MEISKTYYLSLVSKAFAASEAYYNTDVLLMDDVEYDELLEEIRVLSEENGWTEADDLFTEVAVGLTPDGADVVHSIPMLSLGKVTTVDDVAKFVDLAPNQMVLEPKLDGLAISVKYKDGKIVQVATRGNGKMGEDITARLGAVDGLPTVVNFLKDFEVRGEIFMTEPQFVTANFNRMNHILTKWSTKNGELVAGQDSQKTQVVNKLVQIGLKDRANKNVTELTSSSTGRKFTPVKHIFANPRNAVAGALRKLVKDYDVPMSYSVYDVIVDGRNDSYLESMGALQKLGFIPAVSLMPKLSGDILDQLNQFGGERTKVAYPTDGAVVKIVSYSLREKLGERSREPRWAVAYKYPSKGIETVVEDIEVTIGRTGRLALRAKVHPVMVDGTLIQYLSLHNVSWLQEKDIRVGDTILVRRANDVIPYADAPVLSLRPATATQWVAPENCPQCGSLWDKSTLLWRCPSPSCGVINGLVYASSRDCYDWEGMSEAILTRLYDTGLIEDIGDVFKLTKKQLSELEMRESDSGNPVLVGDKVAEKIYTQIQKSKTRPLSAVLTALGVRWLGRTFGRRLEAAYPGMTEILKATPEDLTKVEGIALPKAQVIHAGLREKLPVIQKLNQAGVTMVSAKPKNTTNPFVGKKIAITGSIPGYSRGQAQELLTSLGASATSSVSKNTDYLVSEEGNETNSKYVNAKKFGVPIITPNQFLQQAGLI